MKRKTREEKTIEHSEIIIEDLATLYSFESEAYKEYVKLFEEYKKVTKRFSKTLSMNDSIGRDVIMDNESLKQSVTYTVKKAREKIIYNIEEHRKTKEVLAKYSDTDKNNIAALQEEVSDLKKHISQLENKIDGDDEVHHQFEQSPTKVHAADINNVELKNISYQSLITKYINTTQRKNLKFSVAKLTIDDFDQKIQLLNNENSNKDTIIKVLHKFFTTSISSKNIVYYYDNNIFYLIFPNRNSQEIQEFIDKVNVKRKLLNVIFTFSIGIAQFELGDQFGTFQERLNKAHKEASANTMLN